MRVKVTMKQLYSAFHIDGVIPTEELENTHPNLKEFAPSLNFILKV